MEHHFLGQINRLLWSMLRAIFSWKHFFLAQGIVRCGFYSSWIYVIFTVISLFILIFSKPIATIRHSKNLVWEIFGFYDWEFGGKRQFFQGDLQPVSIWLFKCSKTKLKKIYNFKKKICMVFTKSFFFSKKVMYLFSKNLILLKKNSLCKRIHSAKQTHSVKHEFFFQFNFTTNEQV